MDSRLDEEFELDFKVGKKRWVFQSGQGHVSPSREKPKSSLLYKVRYKYVCCCVRSWSSSRGRRWDERNLRPQGRHRYGLVTLIASRHGHTGSASQAVARVRDGDTEEWRGRALDEIAFHRKGHGKRGSWRKRGKGTTEESSKLPRSRKSVFLLLFPNRGNKSNDEMK